jgi:hypothetical protein
MSTTGSITQPVAAGKGALDTGSASSASANDAGSGDMAKYSKETQQTARETMAFQMMMGRINQQQGFVTALTNLWEAQGQAAKGRGEASKQLV